MQNHLVNEGEVLHPAVQIYIWCLLALAAQIAGGKMLMLLAATSVLLSLRLSATPFIFLLRRTRWILISILFIYMYTGQGEMLLPQLGVFSPVVDGVADGMFQLLRLLTVLAGLSVLLGLLSHSELIAGFYTLSRPLLFVGVPCERVAVRLALTLRYAESAIQDTASNWRGNFENLLAPKPVGQGFIEMQVVPFSLRDWLWFAVVSASFIGVCL